MRYSIQHVEHPAVTELAEFKGYRVQGTMDKSGWIRQGVIVDAYPLDEHTTIVTLDTGGSGASPHAFAFSDTHPFTGEQIKVEVIRSVEVTAEEFAAHTGDNL